MGKTETVTFQAEITAHFDIPAESKQKDQKYFTACCSPAGGERMIACDNCGEWYHESCHNSVIPSEAWTDGNYKWTCDLC